MLYLGILFFVMVFLGIPVAVGLGLTGVVGIWITQDIPLEVVAARTGSATDNIILLAIPLFVLTGSLMTAGGIAQRLFDLARVLVGHFTGGLAQVNVVLSVFNGGLSGSSAADAAMDCKVTIPQMRKDGYPAAFSGAITAVSGMLSNILPPAIALLVYASLTNTSVGRLFVAAIIPGIILAVAMSATAFWISRRKGYGRPRPRASMGEIWTAFRRSGLALVIPAIVVFGIRFGVFTATEAGAAAVVITFILGAFVYKELKLRDLPGVLARTAVDTGVIMLIIALSAPVAWVLAYNQVPQHLAEFFAGMSDDVLFFLLAVNIFLILGGALMEGVSLLILVAPILAAVAAGLGVDPVHFGIVVVVNVVLGAITPPFGQLVFFVSSMTDIRPEQMFRQIAAFLPMLVLVLALVTYAPDLYLWTVDLFGP